MSPHLYYPTFIYSVTAMALFTGMRFFGSPGYKEQEKGSRDFIMPMIICVIYAFFLGYRPISSFFGDTVNYAYEYYKLELGEIGINWEAEWVWEWFRMLCVTLGFDVSFFFTLVDLLYFLTVLYAVKIIMPDNVLLGMLFVLSSLMFYTFGVNGIRNGVACHILLLAFAFFFKGNLPIAIALALTAFGTHRSVALPIASCVAALYLVKNVKLALFIWLCSIPLSLVAGGAFTSFFAGLGFDDRMANYANMEIDENDSFSGTGFRWDFLLYSAAPVYLAWYVCIKKQISDNWYNVLCITYLLCNSFWVLVIRATFSNRFAYLSWFMYPFVIAYPLIMLPVWDDQDQKTGAILFAYLGFTLLMSFLWRML